MALAQLTAMFIGCSLALGAWVLAATCRARRGRRLTMIRALLPAVDTGILVLAATSPASPGVRALAAVSFALACLAASIQLTTRYAEPPWWSSFESAFWRYLEGSASGTGSG